jgi:hypothetical protein
MNGKIIDGVLCLRVCSSNVIAKGASASPGNTPVPVSKAWGYAAGASGGREGHRLRPGMPPPAPLCRLHSELSDQPAHLGSRPELLQSGLQCGPRYIFRARRPGGSRRSREDFCPEFWVQRMAQLVLADAVISGECHVRL